MITIVRGVKVGTYIFTGNQDSVSFEKINFFLIFQAAMMQMRFTSRLAKLALSSMLEVLKEKPIVQHTVNELMWGYSDPLLKIAKDILPPDKTFPFDKFGFFYKV